MGSKGIVKLWGHFLHIRQLAPWNFGEIVMLIVVSNIEKELVK